MYIISFALLCRENSIYLANVHHGLMLGGTQKGIDLHSLPSRSSQGAKVQIDCGETWACNIIRACNRVLWEKRGSSGSLLGNQEGSHRQEVTFEQVLREE